MSAPFMAGVSGLLFQAKGKSAQVGRTARTLFQSTASFIPSSKAEGALLHTATQQGAGLIQAYDAIFATTILSRTELLLNDTAHFDGVYVPLSSLILEVGDLVQQAKVLCQEHWQEQEKIHR
jgi:hypothetical protein